MKSFKYGLIFILLFQLTHAYGDSFQIGTGGLTPHFASEKKDYCNQWNNTGIIANKTYYIRYLGETWGATYMRGNDSICSEIEGIFLHYILKREDWIEYGVTFGGYAFNEENWLEHAEKTPSGIDAPEPVQIDYFGREVVPVLAADVAIILIKREGWNLKLNNLFTPVIFNHSLALEFKF